MEGYIQKLRRYLGHRKFIHPAARIIIENDKGEILLIHRKDNEQWGLIAGAMEEGEDITTCIIREVKEETGLNLLAPVAIGISSSPELEEVIYPNGDEILYFTVVFWGNKWTGELQLSTPETKDARFFPMDQLPSLPPNEASSIPWLDNFKKTGQFTLK